MNKKNMIKTKNKTKKKLKKVPVILKMKKQQKVLPI